MSVDQLLEHLQERNTMRSERWADETPQVGTDPADPCACRGAGCWFCGPGVLVGDDVT